MANLSGQAPFTSAQLNNWIANNQPGNFTLVEHNISMSSTVLRDSLQKGVLLVSPVWTGPDLTFNDCNLTNIEPPSGSVVEKTRDGVLVPRIIAMVQAYTETLTFNVIDGGTTVVSDSRERRRKVGFYDPATETYTHPGDEEHDDDITTTININLAGAGYLGLVSDAAGLKSALKDPIKLVMLLPPDKRDELRGLVPLLDTIYRWAEAITNDDRGRL